MSRIDKKRYQQMLHIKRHENHIGKIKYRYTETHQELCKWRWFSYGSNWVKHKPQAYLRNVTILDLGKWQQGLIYLKKEKNGLLQ